MDGRTKLTDKDVGEIRERYNTGGVTQKQLSAEYAVDQTTISQLVRYKRRTNRQKPVNVDHRKKLTDLDVKRIRNRYASGGVTQQKLAVEYGVTQTAIGLIVREMTRVYDARPAPGQPPDSIRTAARRRNRGTRPN